MKKVQVQGHAIRVRKDENDWLYYTNLHVKGTLTGKREIKENTH